MVDEPRNIHRELLANGLTLLTERMEHIRSVSIGIWVRTGSRHEDVAANGISHFLEHMVFKGTKTRSAEDIARQVDSIGGNMDAFTAKECICFNIKVLDEHLPVAMDVLSDLVLNPIFDLTDLGRERGVILEEIKMDEDNPDYLVHEIFTQNFWKDHPLGKPIAGTKDTVRRFDQELLHSYYARHIHPANLIISAAGNLDEKKFVDLVGEKFFPLKPGKNGLHDSTPAIHPHIIMRNKKSLEQVQICVGVPSHPISHEMRYVSYVLNTLLGGGMSSRLFQTIREDHGLAYAVFSGINAYTDAGYLSVYAATSPEQINEVIRLSIGEFDRLKSETISDAELQRAKDQLKVSIMLGLESTSARMSNLARQEIFFGRQFTLDEILQRIDRVTANDVQRMAQEIFGDELAVTAIGQIESLDIKQ